MKKTFLACAIALSSVTTPVFMPTAVAEITISATEQATQTEQRLKNLIQNFNNVYASSIISSSGIQDLQVSLVDYQTKANAATAKIEIIITFPKEVAEKPITFSIINDISYTPEMLKNNQLAQINSHLLIDENFQKQLQIDDSIFNELKKAIKYLDVKTNLMANDMIAQTIAIKPFSEKTSEQEIKFDGLTLNSQFNQNDLAKIIYNSQSDFKFGQLLITSHPDKTTSNLLKLDSFTGKGKSTETSIDFSTTPIHITYQDGQNQTAVNIDSFTMNGSQLSYDKTHNMLLGNLEYVFHTINVDLGNSLPQPLIFDKAGLTIDTTKNKNLYDFNINYFINPKTDILALFNIQNLMVNAISTKISLNNISEEAFKKFSQFQNSVLQTVDKSSPEINQLVAGILMDLSKTNGTLGLGINLQTSQGEADAKATATLDATSQSDEAWLKAINQLSETNNSDLIDKLIQSAGKLNIDIKAAKAIFDALGVTPIVEQSVPNLKEANGNFVVNIHNEKDKIFINGEEFVLPQSGEAEKVETTQQ